MKARIANPATLSDTEFIQWSNFWKAINYNDLELFTKVIESGLDVHLQWPASKERRTLIIDGRKTLLTIWRSQSSLPLHAAAYVNDEAFVKLLLSYGADTNARSLDGTSALHESIARSNNRVSVLLITHGADVDCKTNAGNPHGDDVTPLQIACKRSDFESAKLLLDAGARPDARAVENALFNSDYRVLQLLLSRGAPLDTASPGAQYARTETIWRRQNLLQRLLTGNYAIEDFLGLSSTMLDNAIEEHDGPFKALVKNLRKQNLEWLEQPAASPPTPSVRLCTYCENLKTSARPIPTLTQVQEVRTEACPICRIIIDQTLWRGQLFNERYSRQKVHVKFSDGRNEEQGLERELSIGYPKGQLARILGKLQDCADVGTQGEGTVALARAWLLNCLTDHKTCSASTKTLPNLPTRVIDVGNHNQQPRLYITHARPGIYCALSYCWGRKPFLRTTRMSLAEHQKSIPLEEFPKTLKDAIQICRQLALQYIWIDALCIVQDDADDWARESKDMVSIYRNAIVTIVASAADDTSGGCFQPRARNRVWPARIPDRLSTEDRRGAMTATNYHSWNHSGDFPEIDVSTDPSVIQDGVYVFPEFIARPKGPVDQRAWCTQEYFVSSRILYWSQEVYWECQCSIASEARPGGNRDPNIATRRIVREASLSTEATVFDRDRMDAILYDWEVVVEDYAQRHITMQSDRLIALAGMASAVGNAINCEYIAGIWGGEQLCRSLLWEVRDLDSEYLETSSIDQSHSQSLALDRGKKYNDQISKQSLFPSWSWASCLSGPRKVVFCRWDEPMRADRKTSRLPLERADTISARVDDIFTVNAIKGEIIINGRLRQMKTVRNRDINGRRDVARNFIQIITMEDEFDSQYRTTPGDTGHDYQLSESPPIETISNDPIVNESAPKEWLDGLNDVLRDSKHNRSNASKSLGLSSSDAAPTIFGDDLMARLQRLGSLREQQETGELRPVPIASRKHYWIKDHLGLDNEHIWCLPIAFWTDLIVGLSLEQVSADRSEFRRIGLFIMERSGDSNWEEDSTFENWKNIRKVRLTLV